MPHSGEDNDYKMLGSCSVAMPAGRLVYGPSAPTIGENVAAHLNNLDAVCLRCHGGTGTKRSCSGACNNLWVADR